MPGVPTLEVRRAGWTALPQFLPDVGLRLHSVLIVPRPGISTSWLYDIKPAWDVPQAGLPVLDFPVKG